MRVLDNLLRLIAPHHCSGCGHEGTLLCEGCANYVRPAASRCYRCLRATGNFNTCPSCVLETPLLSVHAAFAYDDETKRLVHNLKFEFARAAAKTVAEYMAARLTPELRPDTILCYVPTAPSRVRGRGYDQAQLIAFALGNELRLPAMSLLRRDGAQRQVGASGTSRRTQMRGAFRVSGANLVQRAHILLIDDVVTTGSTLEAAARTLQGAGARSVRAAVFAQA